MTWEPGYSLGLALLTFIFISFTAWVGFDYIQWRRAPTITFGFHSLLYHCGYINGAHFSQSPFCKISSQFVIVTPSRHLFSMQPI